MHTRPHVFSAYLNWAPVGGGKKDKRSIHDHAAMEIDQMTNDLCPNASPSEKMLRLRDGINNTCFHLHPCVSPPFHPLFRPCPPLYRNAALCVPFFFFLLKCACPLASSSLGYSGVAYLFLPSPCFCSCFYPPHVPNLQNSENACLNAFDRPIGWREGVSL